MARSGLAISPTSSSTVQSFFRPARCAAIDVLLAGQRGDGAAPDRVNRQLVPIYHPGDNAHSIGHGPALDNGMFLVALVYHYHRHFADAAYVEACLPALRRALAFIPRNRGLVFNDVQRPSSTYGFQDTVAKGGHDLFCSLLWIVACRHMAELDLTERHAWLADAAHTEQALELLWDEPSQCYLAANECCRQVDIWGNAFLVAEQIGPLGRRRQVAEALARHYDEYVYHGQVCHLLQPDHWERLLSNIPPGTYQNGGYWGTASGWLIEALQLIQPALAEKTFHDLLTFYQKHGVLEWVSPEGGKGPDLYVSTILNVWALIKKQSRGHST